MTAADHWRDNVAGIECPFDSPRERIGEYFIEVQPLSIATLYLERIQTYRGHCVLVFDPRHVTRIDELSADEWRQLSQDLQRAEKAVMAAFAPDHINIASIGQVVAHLHWHIIPRYLDDPRWGGPIWMTSAADMQNVRLSEAEYGARVDAIRACL